MKRIFYKIEFFIIVLLAIFSLLFDKEIILGMASIQHAFLIYLMQWVTHLGSVFIVMVFMSSLFMWHEHKKKWIPILWLSFLTSGIVSFLLKLLIARPRPMDFAFPIIGSSFPSIHAAIAFATVPILDKEFPFFKWFWILFAIGVGISRVFFSYHYLSDVFAGAIIGYVIGHFFLVEEERKHYIEFISKHIKKWI